MLCDKCKKNVATVHMQTVINGVSKEEHLCSECANEKSSEFGSFVNEFFSPLEDFGHLLDFENDFMLPKICDCGTTFDDIVSTGKVGCNNCYANYKDLLNEAVKSINIGANKCREEISKEDDKSRKIKELRMQINDAVEKEDYETASKLKKQIDELNKQN